MTGFRGDVEQLSRRAGEFDELADRARRITEHVHRAVESSGNCWGSDEVGLRFAATHQPRTDRALELLDAMPERLAGVGEKFAETAATYRRVDEAGAEDLDDTTRTWSDR